MQFQLDGETALVTGGGTGIGRAIAAAMTAAGARVVITGRRKALLEQTACELGPRVSAVPFDIAAAGGLGDFLGRVEAAAGAPVSLLVNNAGNHVKKPALDTDEKDFDDILHTHLLGPMTLTRAVAAGMLARGAGHVLFITSMAAAFGIPGVSAYTAAKSALAGLVKALAVEWSPKGVRVNAIAPGWISTELMHRAVDADPARKARILERTPLGRFGETEDIGWAAVYLSSPAARFITGQQLCVDGGISIGF